MKRETGKEKKKKKKKEEKELNRKKCEEEYFNKRGFCAVWQKQIFILFFSVRELRQALDNVLADDQDMSLMYLTYKLSSCHPRRVDDHWEAELLVFMPTLTR